MSRLTALVEESGFVAIDPRKLRPAQLVQLLNSTPIGEAIGERMLYRHRARAGLRIGDGRCVDLLRYVAWLVAERHAPRPAFEGLAGYEAHRERVRARQAERSRSGRDIGEIPPVKNPERREACRHDFRRFCDEYMKQSFSMPGIGHLPWSRHHLDTMRIVQSVCLYGGLFSVAQPRGFGKTVTCEAAVKWVTLYGHHLHAAIVGPDEQHALDRISNIRIELEHNDALFEDFPEVCYPIRCLEGINQRRLIYHGSAVRIVFTANRIILPDIERSQAAGSVISTCGITGQIRGLNLKRKDGTPLRPTFMLIDDPQTPESARSPTQCAFRERVINGDILGLSSPGQPISAVMPCTVIVKDDLADRFLDREKNPEWQGRRTKFIESLPTNMKLWEQYRELRKTAFCEHEGDPMAIARICGDFYQRHREAMDDGARVAWPEMKYPDELSGLQRAMNLWIQRGEQAFAAEYQNEPLSDTPEDNGLLTADEIAAKLNGHRRGEVPIGCTLLTMFIDVQQKALFWIVVGWEENFTGHVVDYGTEPDQKQVRFTLRDLRRTLAMAAPRAGLEGSIYAGLERLCARTVGKEWKQEDGAHVRIDRCLIDANWGQSTDVVYQFCRQSPYAGVLMPSHGRYVGASSIPFSEYRRKRGDRAGLNWRIPAIVGRRAVRHVTFDTNFWKSFVQARLAMAMGDPGGLSLFGRDAQQHRLLAEHLTSEYCVKTQGRGRTVDEWKLRLTGLDNHWLDGLVGSAVAASMRGASMPCVADVPRKRKRVPLSMMGRS